MTTTYEWPDGPVLSREDLLDEIGQKILDDTYNFLFAEDYIAVPQEFRQRWSTRGEIPG